MSDNNQDPSGRQQNQYYAPHHQQQPNQHVFHQQAAYAQQNPNMSHGQQYGYPNNQGYNAQMNYPNQYGQQQQQQNQYYAYEPEDDYEQDDFDNLAEIDRVRHLYFLFKT